MCVHDGRLAQTPELHQHQAQPCQPCPSYMHARTHARTPKVSTHSACREQEGRRDGHVPPPLQCAICVPCMRVSKEHYASPAPSIQNQHTDTHVCIQGARTPGSVFGMEHGRSTLFFLNLFLGTSGDSRRHGKYAHTAARYKIAKCEAGRQHACRSEALRRRFAARQFPHTGYKTSNQVLLVVTQESESRPCSSHAPCFLPPPSPPLPHPPFFHIHIREVGMQSRYVAHDAIPLGGPRIHEQCPNAGESSKYP